MADFRSLRELTLVRLREFIREPEAVFWTFGFPLFLAVGLGIAFRNRPPEVLRVAIATDTAASGFSESAASEALSALRSDSGLAVLVMDSAAASVALRAGKLVLVVHPASGPAVREPVAAKAATPAPAARSQVRLRILEDVTVPESLPVRAVEPVEARGGAHTFEFDATRPEALRARLVVNDALQRGAGRSDPVQVAERRVTEAGSRYIDFFVPGLLGMNLMGSGIWGVAFSIVTARNKKLLKRLSATPMSRFQYLASYILSRLIFLVVEVVVLLGFGSLVFGVPMRGSLFVLGTVALVGAFSFSALGLLISSRVKTVEAVSGLANLVMVPMWILSGVFFSAANFPDAAQPFIRVLPLTAANDAIRANMLQGAGWTDVWSQLLVLALWLVTSLAVALKIFRWR